MITFVDSSQVAFPEIEAVIRHLRDNEQHQIILYGPEDQKLMLRVKMANYGASGLLILHKENALAERMTDFVEACKNYGEEPENAHIISTNGLDLAAAILMGAEFTWAFDIY